MTTKEMKEFFTLCKEFGVTKIKAKGVFVIFGEQDQRFAFLNDSVQPKSEVEREPTEDELLMWSTPHYDDLRGQRKKAIE